MLKVKKARVVSDVSPNQDGSFWAEIGGSEAVRVAYTSPSYNSNQGGIYAPPTLDQEIIIFEDTNPQDNKPSYFYIATIVDDEPIDSDERISEFKAIRSGGDGKPFDKDNRPVKMTLQNSDNQGISTTSELTNQKRINHVSLDAEMGSYISAGEQGCQIVNEHLDGIVVQGPANNLFPYRSITMTSDGPIFQEAGASINLTVAQTGDDINISNLANTPGLGGGGVTAGNVRIHSKNKDIILRTGAPNALPNAEATRNINIITPKAQIQINGQTGDISIESLGGGSLNLQSDNSINMTAPIITMNGVTTMTGGPMTVDGNTGAVAINGASLDVNCGTTVIKGGGVSLNGSVVSVVGASPPIVGFPGAPSPPIPVPYANQTPILSPAATIPAVPVPSTVVPNSYGDAPD